MTENSEEPKPVVPLIRSETRPANCTEHGDYESKGFGIRQNPIHWSGCPVCAERQQKFEEDGRARQAIIDAQEKLEARLNKSGIPIRYRTKDFASFVADTDGKERALAIAMEFAQNYPAHMEKGTVAVFSGLPGTGKSHLAIAIAQSVMTSYTVLYTSAIDAVRMIRDTWRRDSPQTESQVLGTLASVGLLILDEVGVQYGTEAEQVSLFDIIDKRYRDMMPIILLTNQNKAGMKDFLGDRSFDRLREGGIWVKFDWESQRGSA